MNEKKFLVVVIFAVPIVEQILRIIAKNCGRNFFKRGGWDGRGFIRCLKGAGGGEVKTDVFIFNDNLKSREFH